MGASFSTAPRVFGHCHKPFPGSPGVLLLGPARFPADTAQSTLVPVGGLSLALTVLSCVGSPLRAWKLPGSPSHRQMACGLRVPDGRRLGRRFCPTQSTEEENGSGLGVGASALTVWTLLQFL